MSTESKEDTFPDFERKESDVSLELTLKEEKRLLRRIDLRIVPYASLGMGLVTNVQGLYATRFLLGVFEVGTSKFQSIVTMLILTQAGLFPGLNFIFTMWYTRQELNIRIAIFIMGSSLAGAFGGILAFGIRHMAGIGGKDGWAWIFLLEGLFTLLCAIPALWLIPDFPDTSNILTPKERTKWLHRLAISQGITNSPLPFSSRQVTRALWDWRTYAYGVVYFSVGLPFYSLSLFVPTIIAALGFTNARANLLSAAPYALAVPFAISMSYLSDKYLVRGPIIVASMMLSVVGYSILICDVSETAKFVAVFLAVMGTASASPTAITFIRWSDVHESSRNGIGNSSGILASNVYPASDAPRYIRGHSISLAFSVLSVIVSIGMSIYNYKENARRDRVYGQPNPDGSDCNIIYIQDEVKLKTYGLEGKRGKKSLSLGIVILRLDTRYDTNASAIR
ncbi:hypothetical protein Clacol_004540 [Clathrus columnatus]|uniref:Major facilitator superfamily (MFS) profile domain-containing protein n=1 Tax=Clathrus columnatus TaxID=1419009 RepID=A0AAV5AC68_9AGAM|nr:hypothetical protein Clacol_004540 [Clathrus columnatus]